MWKKVVSAILILFFIGMNIFSSAAIETFKLSISSTERGKTLYVGGSGQGNYTKIQDAIDNASDGDIIFVYSGLYFENVIVDKKLNIMGENKDTTIIDGSYFTYPLFRLVVDGIIVNNFTMQNAIQNEPDEGAIVIEGSYNIIDNNIIIDPIFSQSAIVIHAPSSHNNITSNYVLGANGWGVDLGFSNFNIVSNNTIMDSNYGGIHLVSDNNLIFENTITNNKWDGIFLNGKNNLIYENKLENNGMSGISFFASESNTINRNNIESNNRYGIEIIYSPNNKFIENNFIDNNINDVFFSAAGFSNLKNIWKNNYWNKPRTLPKVIRGELFINLLFITIKIPGINIDWNPAEDPYNI
jgi:parallel beta-helix repeat protein